MSKCVKLFERNRAPMFTPEQLSCLKGQRRSEYDVTNRIHVTDCQSVSREVRTIFSVCYPGASYEAINKSFKLFNKLYEGSHAAYHGCDTHYHNIQHVLDVTLAIARLIAGYEQQCEMGASFKPEQASTAIISALFHDVGYLRKLDESDVKHGAEYTKVHISRGEVFIREHFKAIGMADEAEIAALLIQFTGYEKPIADIKVTDNKYKLLGYMLGTADIIAQMSDRTYLEKCRDHLYPEFILGGLCEKRDEAGRCEVIYDSADDLLKKTPAFIRATIDDRLIGSFQSAFYYAEVYFGGINLYMMNVKKNLLYLESQISDKGLRQDVDSKIMLLRRSTAHAY